MHSLDIMDFSGLPNTPELAFLEFEKRLRAMIGRPSRFVKQDSGDVFQSQRFYVSAIVAFMLEYEIKDLDVIDISEADSSVFRKKIGPFINRVNAYKIRCSLKFHRQEPQSGGTPVMIAPDFRETLGKHLEVIRKIVRQEIHDINKRDAIFDRIAALQREIDASRTTIDRFFNRMLDLSLVVKECGDNITPLLNKIENILVLTAGRPEELVRLALERCGEMMSTEQNTESKSRKGKIVRLLKRA